MLFSEGTFCASCCGVETLYISAMEIVLIKWSIFWSIIWKKPSINGMNMGKWVRLTNINYLIAFWTDLKPYNPIVLGPPGVPISSVFFRDIYINLS